MSRPGTAHARFERNLLKLLSTPYQRIVLFRPRDGEERVIEGAELESTDATMIANERCLASLAEGFVRITVVQTDELRARLDIRHGGIQSQVREGSGEWRRPDGAADDARDSAPRPTPERSMPQTESKPASTQLSGSLLRVIGIANADGSISAQNAKKLKQTRHLVELFRPALRTISAARTVSEGDPLRILDLASGNAYLTFVLADALATGGTPARIHGIERRPELVKQCGERAKLLGFGQVSFSEGTVASAANPFPESPDLVAALHACDTATDEAISVAIRLKARSIFVAPCCQAELAAQLREQKSGPTPGIAHHGLLIREYAAVLTDAIRAEVLDACGYDVDVVEFVDPEHTPKNRLLRAVLRRDTTPRAGRTMPDVRTRCAAMGVTPRILTLVEA